MVSPERSHVEQVICFRARPLGTGKTSFVLAVAAELKSEHMYFKSLRN